MHFRHVRIITDQLSKLHSTYLESILFAPKFFDKGFSLQKSQKIQLNEDFYDVLNSDICEKCLEFSFELNNKERLDHDTVLNIILTHSQLKGSMDLKGYSFSGTTEGKRNHCILLQYPNSGDKKFNEYMLRAVCFHERHHFEKRAKNWHCPSNNCILSQGNIEQLYSPNYEKNLTFCRKCSDRLDF